MSLTRIGMARPGPSARGGMDMGWAVQKEPARLASALHSPRTEEDGLIE